MKRRSFLAALGLLPLAPKAIANLNLDPIEPLAVEPLPIFYCGFSPAKPVAIGTMLTLRNMGPDLDGKWVVLGQEPGLDGEEKLRLARYESDICKFCFDEVRRLPSIPY